MAEQDNSGSPRPGRPPKYGVETKTITISLPKDTFDFLETEVAKYNKSRGEIITVALKQMDGTINDLINLKDDKIKYLKEREEEPEKEERDSRKCGECGKIVKLDYLKANRWVCPECNSKYKWLDNWDEVEE